LSVVLLGRPFTLQDAKSYCLASKKLTKSFRRKVHQFAHSDTHLRHSNMPWQITFNPSTYNPFLKFYQESAIYVFVEGLGKTTDFTFYPCSRKLFSSCDLLNIFPNEPILIFGKTVETDYAVACIPSQLFFQD